MPASDTDWIPKYSSLSLLTLCPAPSSLPPASSSHWNSTGISRCLESDPPIIFHDSWADFSQMLEISSNSGSQSNFRCCCFSKFISVHGLLYLLSYIFGVHEKNNFCIHDLYKSCQQFSTIGEAFFNIFKCRVVPRPAPTLCKWPTQGLTEDSTG